MKVSYICVEISRLGKKVSMRGVEPGPAASYPNDLPNELSSAFLADTVLSYMTEFKMYTRYESENMDVH